MIYNFIQYGLGDNNTFVQTILKESHGDTQRCAGWQRRPQDESRGYPEMMTLLEAIKILVAHRGGELSEQFTDIRGISLDVIKTFANRFTGLCQENLKGCYVRQYAGGRAPGFIDVYGLPQDILERISNQDTYEEACLWTKRNMSSTGKSHPALENDEQVLLGKVEVKTYEQIVNEFKIEHLDVLQIDTEGDDCYIIDGVIDACKRGVTALPSIISFETQGHANLKYEPGLEQDTVRKLQLNGYYLTRYGSQTFMVHETACKALKQWTDKWHYWGTYCIRCRDYRWSPGMPKEKMLPNHWISFRTSKYNNYGLKTYFYCPRCWPRIEKRIHAEYSEIFLGEFECYETVAEEKNWAWEDKEEDMKLLGSSARGNLDIEVEEEEQSNDDMIITDCCLSSSQSTGLNSSQSTGLNSSSGSERPSNALSRIESDVEENEAYTPPWEVTGSRRVAASSLPELEAKLRQLQQAQ